MPEAGELYLLPKRENNWHLNNVVNELRRVRQAWRDEHAKNNYRNKRSLPSRESVNSVADTLIKVLYPMRLGDVDLRKEGEDYYVGHLLGTALDRLTEEALLELYYQSDEQAENEVLLQEAVRRVQQFANRLPVIRQRLDGDILAAYQGDPSARSMDDVLLCYPGIHAVMHYRLAHELHQLDLPLLARIITERRIARPESIFIPVRRLMTDSLSITEPAWSLVKPPSSVNEYVFIKPSPWGPNVSSSVRTDNCKKIILATLLLKMTL